MFAQPGAATAGLLVAGLLAAFAGQAAGQTRDQLREQFLGECRAQVSHLTGPAYKEERTTKVTACVQAKFAAHSRALAQRAVAMAGSARSELKLVETRPWLVAADRGPAEAKGVVYFVRGYGTTVDAFAPVPYFIKTLSDEGWDVIAAKVPQGTSKDAAIEVVGAGAAFMRRRMSDLKGQGYKRVVLSGHSWGAWAALLAAQNPDFAADALLVSAPAIFGQRVSLVNGKPNPSFGLNLSELPAALNKVKTPSVMILPDDTTFDPDPARRGAMIEKYFERANVALLPFIKPPGFTGHLAGWLPIFDYAFGKCIAAFIENPSSSPCTPPPLSNADFRSIVDIQQVAEAGSRGITSAESLVGKKFLAYTLSASVTQHYEYVSATQRKHMQGTGTTSEGVSFRKELHCVGSQCSKLLKWNDGQLLEFDAKGGRLVGWWVERR